MVAALLDGALPPRRRCGWPGSCCASSARRPASRSCAARSPCSPPRATTTASATPPSRRPSRSSARPATSARASSSAPAPSASSSRPPATTVEGAAAGHVPARAQGRSARRARCSRATRRCRRELDEALQSLAGQVVLALESIARTETLVEERKELESELVRQAHEDPVTGLPNRTHFLERVELRAAPPHAGGARRRC